MPPPHIVKQMVVLQYAKTFGTNILIETGTYLGEMVEAMRRHFERVYSIELDRALYESAKDRFRRFEHIRILHGDSGEMLPIVLTEVQKPCLFWLDGHYSGGITGKGAQETPILKELEYIFFHPIRDHVILIDDARCFVGSNDYPSLGQLRDLVRLERPDLIFEVADDVIRIHPPHRGTHSS